MSQIGLKNSKICTTAENWDKKVQSLNCTNVYLDYDYMIIIKDTYFNQLSLWIRLNWICKNRMLNLGLNNKKSFTCAVYEWILNMFDQLTVIN